MPENIIKVGCGVLIFKDGKVLLGKRKGAHGAGFWSGGGGHLEFRESLEGAIIREIQEECGVEVTNLRFLCVNNEKADSEKHYVNIGFTADWVSGEPKLLEPDCFEGWAWYDLNNLPSPLFESCANYFESLKTGNNFFDA